jgi:hypothetical protein
MMQDRHFRMKTVYLDTTRIRTKSIGEHGTYHAFVADSYSRMLVRDGTAGRDVNKISYNVNHAHLFLAIRKKKMT